MMEELTKLKQEQLQPCPVDSALFPGGPQGTFVFPGDPLTFTSAGILPRSVGGTCPPEREVPPELMHIHRATTMPERKFVWNSQQDVAGYLLAAAEHEEWISKEVIIRPSNGTMILYRRSVSSQARNQDGYTWKKKQKRRTVRETHMVLKLNGVECIFANYAHSAILPTFHRRAYFLRHNPNIVLFHYLNVPPLSKDDKLCIPTFTLSTADLEVLSSDRLMDQLRPMFDNFPSRLTKPDGKQVLSFDVASVMRGVAESVLSQREGRAPPAVSPDACFVFSCSAQGRHAVVSCSGGPGPVSTSSAQTRTQEPFLGDTSESLFAPASLISPCLVGLSPPSESSSGQDVTGHPKLRSLLFANELPHTSTQQRPCPGDRSDNPLLASTSLDPAGENVILPSHPSGSGVMENCCENTEQSEYGLLPEQDPLLRDLDLMDCLDWDCLGDLPPLEHSNQHDLAPGPDPLEALVEIRHCAPDWAPTQSGGSMLLAGPWYSSRSPYSCLFGGVEVPAVLVQNGVLSCCVPDHCAGSVLLQVACEGRVISRPRPFHFREVWPGPESQRRSSVPGEQTVSGASMDHWLATEESQLKVWLVEGISQLEQSIVQTRIVNTEPDPEIHDLQESLPLEMVRVRRWLCRDSLEVVLTRCCAGWCRRAFLPTGPTQTPHGEGDTVPPEPLPLLHCAAGLGYAELTRLLLGWFYLRKRQCQRQRMSAVVGEKESTTDCRPEIDLETPAVDRLGLTALQWASVRGHLSSARLLARWCPAALHMRDPQYARTPAQTAECSGHPLVASELHALEAQLVDGGLGGYRPASGVQFAALWEALSRDAGREEDEEGDWTEEEQFDEAAAGQALQYAAGANLGRVGSGAPGDESQMVCLAGRIIQAMPRRIKFSPGPSVASSSGGAGSEEQTSARDRSASHSSFGSLADLFANSHPTPTVAADDSGISTPFDEYRHANLDTPSSSVSPTAGTAGPESLSSPYNFSMDSPPPTTAEIAEHFNAPATYMEADFSRLTLSDLEQKRLYEAAKVIQRGFRAYKQSKARKTETCPDQPSSSAASASERSKEIEAAIIIQSYYRRYKQYAYYKRMCQAAVLIQNQYRWYVEQKKAGSGAGTPSGERLKRNKQSPVMVNQRFRNHYQRKQETSSDTAKSLRHLEFCQLSGSADLFGQSILPQRNKHFGASSCLSPGLNLRDLLDDFP